MVINWSNYYSGDDDVDGNDDYAFLYGYLFGSLKNWIELLTWP